MSKLENTNDNLVNLTDVKNKIKEKNKKFSELLEQIDEVDDRKKSLFLEIYNNAVEDRENAYMLLFQLVNLCDRASTEIAVHGRTINQYMERMSKANDQLIRLTELINSEEQRSDIMNPEEIWDKLSKVK